MNVIIKKKRQKLLAGCQKIKCRDRYWKNSTNDKKAYERHEENKMFLNLIEKKRNIYK
jgi:hypothetical protein